MKYLKTFESSTQKKYILIISDYYSSTSTLKENGLMMKMNKFLKSNIGVVEDNWDDFNNLSVISYYNIPSVIKQFFSNGKYISINIAKIEYIIGDSIEEVKMKAKANEFNL